MSRIRIKTQYFDPGFKSFLVVKRKPAGKQNMKYCNIVSLAVLKHHWFPHHWSCKFSTVPFQLTSRPTVEWQFYTSVPLVFRVWANSRGSHSWPIPKNPTLQAESNTQTCASSDQLSTFCPVSIWMGDCLGILGDVPVGFSILPSRGWCWGLPDKGKPPRLGGSKNCTLHAHHIMHRTSLG